VFGSAITSSNGFTFPIPTISENLWVAPDGKESPQVSSSIIIMYFRLGETREFIIPKNENIKNLQKNKNKPERKESLSILQTIAFISE
jgi:hypothetical protein